MDVIIVSCYIQTRRLACSFSALAPIKIVGHMLLFFVNSWGEPFLRVILTVQLSYLEHWDFFLWRIPDSRNLGRDESLGMLDKGQLTLNLSSKGKATIHTDHFPDEATELSLFSLPTQC